jgi:uncharacterized membrane protein
VFLRLNLLLLMFVVFLPFPTTLVTEAFGDEELARVRRTSLTGILMYVVAIVGGIAFPGIAVSFYFLIGLYLVIPWRQVAHLAGGRPAS